MIDHPARPGGATRSGWRRRRRVLARGLGALLVIALAGCGSRGGSATSAPSAEDSYGALPSFLPTPAITPDSVLTGTVGRPALTSQGDDVDVRVHGASVLARVSGPAVPVAGLPYRAPTVTCTFTVALAARTGSVPIDLADFAVVDHLGRVYRVIAVPGREPKRATLAGGRATTFELRTVLPTGEGLLRWAPGGRQVVASWDFTVETD